MSRKQEVNARLAKSRGIPLNRRPRTPMEDDPRARRIAAMDAGPTADPEVPIDSTLKRNADGTIGVARPAPTVSRLPPSATLQDVIAKLNEMIGGAGGT